MYLLFKTAQAEFRCWQHLQPSLKASLIPIIEITRGRKIPKKGQGLSETEQRRVRGIYDFDGNVAKCVQHFLNGLAFVDLTREIGLSCREIEELLNPAESYGAWRSFFCDLKSKNNNFSPVMQVNTLPNWQKADYVAALQGQFDFLAKKNTSIAYRLFPSSDPEGVYDIAALKDAIQAFIDKGNSFYVILDNEFLRKGGGAVIASENLKIMRAITTILPDVFFIILGTSFPKSIGEHGDPEHDTLPVEEIVLFKTVQRGVNFPAKLYYGDYGTINPERNDLAFARGWRPRIDYSTGEQIFYYREKRTQDYATHYKSVAQKILADDRFEEIPGSWGVECIKKAAAGDVRGKSPSFWISVRMDIHLSQRLRKDLIG